MAAKLIEEIRLARRDGVLPERFTPAQLQDALPHRPRTTCTMFPHKHRVGNDRDTELFVKHGDGTYSLYEDSVVEQGGTRRELSAGVLSRQVEWRTIVTDTDLWLRFEVFDAQADEPSIHGEVCIGRARPASDLGDVAAVMSLISNQLRLSRR